MSFFFGLSIAVSTPALANGWEHGAIKFEALVKALSAEEASLRTIAIHSMGIRGDRQAIGHLMRHHARGEKDNAARRELYAAFGKLQADKAANVLARCVRSEKRVEIRATCIASLGQIPRKLAWSKLWSLRGDVSSLLERSVLIDALGNFSAEDSVAFLIKTANGPNASLKRRALIGLGKTRSDKAANFLLQRLKAEKKPDIQQLLVKALGRLGSKLAAGEISIIARTASDDELRIAAAIALSAINEGSSGPALVKLLKDPLPAVRFIALQTLGQLKYQSGIDPIKALGHNIHRRLSAMDGKALLADYANVLGDLSVMVEALRALYEISPQAATQTFIRAAKGYSAQPEGHAVAFKIREGFYEQRRMALYALGYTNSPDALPVLLGNAGVQDDDPRLRLVAVRSLGVLEKKSALPALIKALNDDNKDVRTMAAKVLGLLNFADGLHPLLAASTDKMASVRHQVAVSLGLLGDETAGDVLKTLSGDRNKKVAQAAAFALKLLK